jgi:Transglutaminase-like superfamily
MYYLSNHIFICKSGFHYVILDLTRDQYVCVDGAEFDCLTPFLHGWDSGEPTVACQAAPNTAASVARSLLDRGILSSTSLNSKSARLPFIHEVRESLADNRDSVECINPRLIYRFFRAATWAKRTLALTPLCDIVNCVSQLRNETTTSVGPDGAHLASRLFGVYDRLRPLFPHKWVCLFDSLALLRFYMLNNFFPKWVFGVVAEPFEAHCWLQYEHSVLNDNLQRVAKFAPIMVV